MKSVVVYCGSKSGIHPSYVDTARSLGKLLAERGMTLVYGGGKIGLMGVVSDSVMTAGGTVIGVITKQLNAIEVGSTSITELIVVETMHDRKRLMCERAEGSIILPGAYGTLDELFEFVTWTQLDIHNKPCGILNVNGFYDHLIAHINSLVREGFLNQGHRDLISVSTDVGQLLELMSAWRAAHPVPEQYKLV